MALRRRPFEGALLGKGRGRGGERSGNGHGAVGENTQSNTDPGLHGGSQACRSAQSEIRGH